MVDAVTIASVAPLRKEDSHRSEMVSQLLFGENVKVLEEKGDWLRIQSGWDDYEGWVTHHMIERIEADRVGGQAHVASDLINPVTLPGSLMHIPMGSFLYGMDAETRLLWNESYKYHGLYRDLDGGFDEDLLIRMAYSWLNAPYLWGGKTYLGVDCSGFVQTIYRVAGIRLHRDAYQQAEQGEVVGSLAEAKRGDLAFFHNEQGRITHVGMLLNDHQIIHASGMVRIDTITAEGIINNETRKRTHDFHSIRRVH